MASNPKLSIARLRYSGALERCQIHLRRQCGTKWNKVDAEFEHLHDRCVYAVQILVDQIMLQHNDAMTNACFKSIKEAIDKEQIHITKIVFGASEKNQY